MYSGFVQIRNETLRPDPQQGGFHPHLHNSDAADKGPNFNDIPSSFTTKPSSNWLTFLMNLNYSHCLQC